MDRYTKDREASRHVDRKQTDKAISVLVEIPLAINYYTFGKYEALV